MMTGSSKIIAPATSFSASFVMHLGPEGSCVPLASVQRARIGQRTFKIKEFKMVDGK